MAKITYEDKVDVLVSSLPNKNKINAGDMNQIKNSVNELETDISNGVVEAKTYANTKVNDLVIGGTNILLSTQKPTDTILGGRGILTDTMYKNCYVVTCDNIGSSASKDVVKWDIVIAPEPDTEYTLSFWAKGSGRMSSFFYSDTCASGYSNKGVTTSVSSGEIVHTLESNWTKYIITWKTLSTVSGNKTMLPCRILAGGNLTGACAFKFEIGNKATDWSPNSEDLTSKAKTYTDTKVDDLEVGGRNYIPLSSLRNTISYDSFSKSTGLCTFVDGEYVIVERTTIATARGGIYKNIDFTDCFQIGDTVTLSAEIYIESLGEGTQNGSIFMRSYKASNESSTLKDLCSILIDSSCAKGKWIRVSNTETITNTDTLLSKMSVQIMCGYGIAKFRVRNVKFEKGNKATDWVLAPEDLISEAKTYADKKIDNLEIGGRNIVLNSNTRIVAGYGSPTITHESNIVVSEWGATDAKRVYGKSGTNKIFGTLATGRDAYYALKNKEYVFSIYIKNNHASNLLYISANGLTGTVSISSGESQRVIMKCAGNGTSYLSTTFQTSSTGIEYDFTYWHYQIEEGTIVSDWTPAPEDIVDNTEWQAVSDISIGNLRFKRKSGFVTLVFNITLPLVAAWTELATLPLGFRPSNEVYCSLHRNAADTSVHHTTNISVNANGLVKHLTPQSAGSYLGSITFPID